MTRCFVAVDMPLGTGEAQAYAKVTAAIVSSPRVKPVELKNLHVTLKFIGEVDDDTLARIREALRGIRYRPFRVNLRGLGAFPSLRNPRVLWIGIDEGADDMRTLRDAVEEALSGIVPREREGFVAHLTIARVKGPTKLPLQLFTEMEDQDFGTVDVSDFKLKRSVLTQSGPIYYDLEVYRLGGSGEGSGEGEG